MMVMARALWNRDLPFDEIVDDLYRATFGGDWEEVKQYTRRLSELFHPPFLRGEENEVVHRGAVHTLEQVSAEIERFLPVIKANVNVPEVCHARSWRYLREHADICLAMAPAVAALAGGDQEEACRAALRLVEGVRRKERRIHRVFDVALFIQTIGRVLGLSKEELQ
jgi:hypothetical protein